VDTQQEIGEQDTEFAVEGAGLSDDGPDRLEMNAETAEAVHQPERTSPDA
jgi:hypothetical protein